MLLYKYVTEERLSILEDGLIRFTQPHVFNDPFDFNPHINSIASEQHIKRLLEKNIKSIFREEYDKKPINFKQKIPFPAFFALADTQREKLKAGIINNAKHDAPLKVQSALHSGFGKHIGILSLTENPKNLLMWAHYANSHQGFVIELYGAHEFFDQRKSDDDQLRHLKKVKYSSKRPSLELRRIKGIDDFLIKGDDWGYEQEWRIIFALNDATQTKQSKPHDIYLFKVPFPAIKSILIGARASQETKDKITNIVESNSELKHIKISSVVVHESKFELKF